MAKFVFKKLVRDKIVAQQLAAGAKPHYKRLQEPEHIQALVEKIIEEAQEIADAPTQDRANEIADVQQALDDLKEQCHLTDKDVENAQYAKRDKNGAFREGLYIDYVEINDNDPWVTYYRAHPDRYPEIK